MDIQDKIYKQRKQALAIPLFKCHPPPCFDCLKTVILQHYGKISYLVPQPRFVSLALPNLQKSLISRTGLRYSVATQELITKHQSQVCRNPSKIEKTTSTSQTMQQYKMQHMQTPELQCYLHKQHHQPELSYTIHCHVYLFEFNILDNVHQMQKAVRRTNNKTTKRPNKSSFQHNISKQNTIYLCIHLIFPDHGINHLSVQVIDKVPMNTHKSINELQQLERFWIHTLKTLQPQGLNNSQGFRT